MIDFKFISKAEAQEIRDHLLGIPTMNRVLILNPSDEEKVTSSGLVIPGTAQEDLPKKGVIVSVGPLDETYKEFSGPYMVGNIVTFGNYAGKKIEPLFTSGFSNKYPGKFYVLSINEILYIESNN